MEQQNVEIVSGGLKCDNPKCDWRDDTVTFDDYEKWLNARCPKCGQNVLTEKDFENVQMVRLMSDFLNTLSPEELKEMSAGTDIEKLKESPFFENTQGLELLNLNSDEKIVISLETHNEVKSTEIRKHED